MTNKNNSIYKLTKYEQETSITYNQEENIADVYTHDKTLMKKLDKFCKLYPDKCLLKREDKQWQSKTYIIPKNFISIRTPRLINISDEQRAKSKELMKKINKKIIE